MTAPQNPFTADVPPAEPFDVLIGDDDGSDVTSADVDEDVQVVSLTRSAGGQRLDHVSLIFSLARSETRLVDKKVPFDFSRKVQVRLADSLSEEDAEPVPVFSGELAIEAAAINRSGEFCKLQARLDPWHFGDPLLGPQVLDVDGVTVLTPDLPIVFNPEIDGRIEPNMSRHVDAEGGWSFWVDPESTRTTKAAGVQNEFADGNDLWDLPNAVLSLCFACNMDEKMIVNPTLTELEGVFGDDPPALRNVILPRGRRLPELLDALLPRFGFNWFIQPAVDDDGSDDPPVKNYLRVFALGEGRKTQVFLQRPAQPPPKLDLAKSNVPELEVQWNIADAANVIIGQGSAREVEGTFELYRAWEELDDELGPDDLRKVDDDDDEGSKFKEKPDVWRKWVLNEAGDYCNLRTSIAPIPATPFTFGREAVAISAVQSGSNGSQFFQMAGDHTAVLLEDDAIQVSGSTGNDGEYTIERFISFGGSTTIWPNEEIPSGVADGKLEIGGMLGPNTLIKRRRFHHCLTRDAAGERRDVYVQYRDPEVVDDNDPAAWKALPHETWSNISFHVLQKECGIYFNGPTPPPDLMALDDPALAGVQGRARLRVTAVVRADDRLQARADRTEKSPNLNPIKLFVDLSDRFHWREIQTAGLYKSALRNETTGADTVDDFALLQQYVDSLQAIEQSARISCEFELMGIQTAYEIGDLVTNVTGREISLNRNSWMQEEKLYPQITAITFDRARQRTRLRVETFDWTAQALKKLSLG